MTKQGQSDRDRKVEAPVASDAEKGTKRTRPVKKMGGPKFPAELVAIKALFLESFAEYGNIRLAATTAGVNRSSHYGWLKKDPEYAARFASAQEDAIEVLEYEARRRAVIGVPEPVGFYKGQPSAYVQRYSDVLLIFLLKGLRPEMYRDRYEVTGKDGGPLETKVTFYLPQKVIQA